MEFMNLYLWNGMCNVEILSQMHCFGRFHPDCKASWTECSSAIQQHVQLHSSYCNIRSCARLAHTSVSYL